MNTSAISSFLRIIMCISAIGISASLIYLYLDMDFINNRFQGVTQIERRIDVDIRLQESKTIKQGIAMETQDSFTEVGQEERDLCNRELSLPLPKENIDVSTYRRCINVHYSDWKSNRDIVEKFSDPNYQTRQDEHGKPNAKVTEIQDETFEKMGIFVQRILRDLQNPLNCSRASKVMCRVTSHGFACALHHIAFCFMNAYATNRSLVLNTDANRYGKSAWAKFLRPISENCSYDSGNMSQVGRGKTDAQVDYVGRPRKSLRFPFTCPLAMPPEILEMGRGLEFDIMAWWTGQILSVVFRFVPELDAEVSERAVKIGFQSPIVGIHIRRSDKLIREADKFSVEEYMEHAERFYEKLASVSRITSRKVYLATDDPRVIDEARAKYPAYTIIADRDVALSAIPKKRSNEDGLKGILLDLYFLSRSDHLICTFSSSVCRLAYELRQARLLNASRSTISLDCPRSYLRIYQFPRLVPCKHIPIRFGAYDLIYSYSPLSNGYSVGRNLNSSSKSQAMSPYKVKDGIVPYCAPVI